MATHTGELDVYASSLDRRPDGLRQAQQAYGLLYVVFIVAPIVAGLSSTGRSTSRRRSRPGCLWRPRPSCRRSA
jgi:hypothetical protein